MIYQPTTGSGSKSNKNEAVAGNGSSVGAADPAGPVTPIPDVSSDDRDAAVIDQIRALAEGGRKIVFVSGVFNIIHPGHLRLLRFAAECGDVLVVGVLSGNIPREAVPAELRLEALQSIGFVHFSFLLESSPAEFISRLQPDVVVKGSEHEERFNPEQEVVEVYGGKLLFGSGDISFSSFNLLKDEYRRATSSTITHAADYLKRNQLTLSELRGILDTIKGLEVLVIGDSIVDEYVTCDPLGMSQEDPTLVVMPVQKERFIGGAAVVAAHARGLGASVKFFSVVGHDEPAAFLREKLAEYNVDATLIEDESRPTSLKTRYRANGKTLLRVNQLRQHAISKPLMKEMSASIKKAVSSAQLVVFSDFNYGALPQWLVDQVTSSCAERGVMMVADSQSSSQVGDVSRFKGATLMTPTEREARIAVRDQNSGLVVLAESLRRKARAKNVVITLGAEGLLIHSENPSGPAGEEWKTDRIPALNSAPKDVAGAGDAFLLGSSLALAAGQDIWRSSYFGSLAAAIQVGRLGNIPLTQGEIREELDFGRFN